MTQEIALKILQTGANVFLTGEPGSGKTHTVNQYVSWLRSHDIEPAITASTGIAATHIGGYTIHSWSGIGIKRKLDKYDLDRIASTEYIVKRVRRSKILIIDEVSMLSPDTLSMVDMVCREILQNQTPFGGLQIIFVGDFFQLPPIVKAETEQVVQLTLADQKSPRFAYDSASWTQAKPLNCYLTEQHRQDDSEYLSVLSAIRRNSFDETHLEHITKRKIEAHAAPKDAPKLFSHNADVDRINNEMLAGISGTPKGFPMTSQGAPALVTALKKSCLSPEALFLKPGAAVMFTKNSPKNNFVNGTLGTVDGFSRDSGAPIVKTRNGRRIEVEPMEWTVEENGKIRARIAQFPLRLAWAITVHKSQGMSLDEAVMDLRDVFEFGQGYVALSRVRRLSGLHILGWNKQTFQVHPEVLQKDLQFREQSDETERLCNVMTKDELANMHKNFVVACGGKTEPNVSTRTPKTKLRGGTLDETLALFKSGNSIAEIASARGLVETTVSAHIFDLYTTERIGRDELKRLVSPALTEALPTIHSAFREIGVERLSPIFEKFRGKYSYDDLRLARMLLK